MAMSCKYTAVRFLLDIEDSLRAGNSTGCGLVRREDLPEHQWQVFLACWHREKILVSLRKQPAQPPADYSLSKIVSCCDNCELTYRPNDLYVLQVKRNMGFYIIRYTTCEKYVAR